MKWHVFYHAAFEAELRALEPPVRDALVAGIDQIETWGPQLGRPTVDTLKGSRHANMKELRVTVSGLPWRLAFAFDPLRPAIILVCAHKAGVSQALFYRRLITIADARFDQHLKELRQ